MAKRKAKTSKLPINANPYGEYVTRDTAMFKDWIGGMKRDQIAVKYEMSIDNVTRIALKYNWKGLKKELIERSFNRMLDSMTSFSADILTAFYADFKLVMESVAKDKRSLTGEERAHLRALWDRMLKEKRLEDGNPTDLPTGTVKVELVVPNGVQHVGVIPVPKSNITTVQKEPEQETAPVIDLDGVEGND
jgi:hypothetical protein